MITLIKIALISKTTLTCALAGNNVYQDCNEEDFMSNAILEKEPKLYRKQQRMRS
jgi:hypothetical protein